MNPVLLVTGFGPFQNYPENPSGDIAETVHSQTVADVRIVGLRVPVRWGEAWKSIHAAVLEHEPNALLCLGVAPDPFFRLEIMARNIASPSVDTGGQLPKLSDLWRLIPDAPPAYWTTLPIEWLEERLRERFDRLVAHGVKTPVLTGQRWPDAGSYLCNHVFFHAMHFLRETVPYRGFIHVPPYPLAGKPGRSPVLKRGSPSPLVIPRQEVLAAGVFLVEELARWLSSKRGLAS